MLRVVQTLTVHLLCIIIFALLYYYFSVHFNSTINNNNNNNKKHQSRLETIIDFFLFSTTIQAGVGISDMIPITVNGKLLMIIQQLLMISIGVLTIYLFTS